MDIEYFQDVLTKDIKEKTNYEEVYSNLQEMIMTKKDLESLYLILNNIFLNLFTYGKEQELLSFAINLGILERAFLLNEENFLQEYKNSLQYNKVRCMMEFVNSIVASYTEYMSSNSYLIFAKVIQHEQFIKIIQLIKLFKDYSVVLRSDFNQEDYELLSDLKLVDQRSFSKYASLTVFGIELLMTYERFQTV